MAKDYLTIDELADVFEALKTNNANQLRESLQKVIDLAKLKHLSLNALQASLKQHGIMCSPKMDRWLSQYYNQCN